jgi:vesicle-fusing ATPase
MRRGHEIAEVFSADEMVRNFIRAYNGIMFAAGEILVFEFHGQTLKGTVRGVGIVDLPTEQHRRAAPHSFRDAGVLMEKTDVNFLKAGDSAIKIKSSGKK